MTSLFNNEVPERNVVKRGVGYRRKPVPRRDHAGGAKGEPVLHERRDGTYKQNESAGNLQDARFSKKCDQGDLCPGHWFPKAVSKGLQEDTPPSPPQPEGGEGKIGEEGSGGGCKKEKVGEGGRTERNLSLTDLNRVALSAFFSKRGLAEAERKGGRRI